MATLAAKDLDRAARWFRALGDARRLRILERLREGEECVCNLTDALDTGQSLLSFHLRILRDAGILRARREGRWVHYSIDPAMVEEVERVLRTLRPTAAASRECCE